MKRFVRRPSPATVLASLALFISLGGVSYGVATKQIGSAGIQNNSVQSRDLRDGSVLGRDITNNTVQSRDLKDNALRGVDVHDRSLGGADLADNTLGDREINEPQLDVQVLGGIDARSYVKRVTRVETKSANDATAVKSAPAARCPGRKRIIGGGARVLAGAPVPVALSANGPAGKTWQASAYATAATGNWQLVNVAICG